MTRCPHCLTIFTASVDDDECPVCREIEAAILAMDAEPPTDIDTRPNLYGSDF